MCQGMNHCNGNGVCGTNGMCTCNDGYGLADCSAQATPLVGSMDFTLNPRQFIFLLLNLNGADQIVATYSFSLNIVASNNRSCKHLICSLFL